MQSAAKWNEFFIGAVTGELSLSRFQSQRLPVRRLHRPPGWMGKHGIMPGWQDVEADQVVGPRIVGSGFTGIAVVLYPDQPRRIDLELDAHPVGQMLGTVSD